MVEQVHTPLQRSVTPSSGALLVISPCGAPKPHVLRPFDVLREAGIDVRATALKLAPPRSLVALDITRCSTEQLPADLDAFRAVELFVLARDDQTMPVSWAHILQSRRATVIIEPTDGPTAHQRLARLLLARVTRRQRALERVVVRLLREAGLGEFTDLARLVLRDPWGIRRPRDLARSWGASRRRLRRWRDHSPFERIEHFIALVRWIAFEHLVKVERLPAPEALAIVGGTGVSNLKRQVEPLRAWWRRLIAK